MEFETLKDSHEKKKTKYSFPLGGCERYLWAKRV